jgi:predicted nucleic acid-binding protein
MILVDTSVWVDHLRHGNDALVRLLNENEVLIHPFVIGELACGFLRNRSEILGLLAELPEAVVADHQEVLDFVERRRLYGMGIGWIDAHLVSSALLSRAGLLALDKPLAKAVSALGISSV